MDDLRLYPNRNGLLRGLAFGVGYLLIVRWALGKTSITDMPGLGVFLVGLVACLGLALIINALRYLLARKPIFHGTVDGFSVRGGRMINWDQLADIRLVRPTIYGFIPLPRSVDIQTKGKLRNKSHPIPNHLLPGQARMTAAVIDGYARAAIEFRHRRPRSAFSSGTSDGGPIKTTRRFGESFALR